MDLTEKQKMLGAALYAHHAKRDTAITVMMVLEDDDQVEDMLWFISQNPMATDGQLVAVAYQLVKDAHNGENI